MNHSPTSHIERTAQFESVSCNKTNFMVPFSSHVLHICLLSFVKYWQYEDYYLTSSISSHVRPYFPTHLPYAVSKHIKLSLTLKYTKITLAHDINHHLHTLPFTHSDTPQKTLPRWRVTLSCTHPQTLHNLTCITLTRTHMHTSTHIKSSGL